MLFKIISFPWLQVVRGDRVPCGHQMTTSESYCTTLGCCWDPTTYEHENMTHCFYPSGQQHLVAFLGKNSSFVYDK